MRPKPKRKKAPTEENSAVQEERRAQQRTVCTQLLERWVPVATAEALALRKEGRNGPVIDEETLETGLKAGAFVLKVVERLARLDGLDIGEPREQPAVNLVDPEELARRVETVSPLLIARLKQADQLRNSGD